MDTPAGVGRVDLHEGDVAQRIATTGGNVPGSPAQMHIKCGLHQVQCEMSPQPSQFAISGREHGGYQLGSHTCASPNSQHNACCDLRIDCTCTSKSRQQAGCSRGAPRHHVLLEVVAAGAAAEDAKHNGPWMHDTITLQPSFGRASSGYDGVLQGRTLSSGRKGAKVQHNTLMLPQVGPLCSIAGPTVM